MIKKGNREHTKVELHLKSQIAKEPSREPERRSSVSE
jgi:hypothetical protein